MGDYHFSQGDGEITFCGAIEMAGWIDLHVDLIKGGVRRNTALSNPSSSPARSIRTTRDYLVFEGICVDDRRATSITST